MRFCERQSKVRKRRTEGEGEGVARTEERQLRTGGSTEWEGCNGV